MENEYLRRTAAAYVRGYAKRTGLALIQNLCDKPLNELNERELDMLFTAGKTCGLKMYRFKSHRDMPRVKIVMGFLRNVMPESLIDVGSGRGVFLLPFLEEFAGAAVTSVDILPYRVEFLNDISQGGYSNLTALLGDIRTAPLPEKSADVVTMLEVLEHIPDVETAARAAVRAAKKFVVVTVPSKPDNNPEHIHLLTKDKLTALFEGAGCKKIGFDGVNGHLFMTARV